MYYYYQRGRNLSEDEPLILKSYVSEDTLINCFHDARCKPYETNEIYVETYEWSHGKWENFKDDIKAHLDNMDGFYFDITGDPVLIEDLPKRCKYIIED